MPIDYSPLFQSTPETGVSRGLSQLTSVLDAIKERKSREAIAKARLDQERQLAAIDDARLQQQADQTSAHWEAESERLKAKDSQESADKASARTEKALPNILQALASKDPTAAQMWAQIGGGKVGEAPRTSVPENAVGDMLNKPQAPADQGPNMSGLPGPFSLLDVARQQRMHAQAAAEADPLGSPQAPAQATAPAPQPQGPPRYRVEMPGQTPIDYDPEEQRRVRLDQGSQLAGDLSGIAGASPFDQRAMADVKRMAATGAFKSRDEMLAEYTKQKNFYEQQSEENKRAQIMAGARHEGQNLVHPAGELDFLDEEGKVIGKTRSPEEGRKFREGRDALVGISQAIGPLREHVLAHGRTDIAGIPIDTAEVRGQREAMISNVTDYLTTLKNTGVLNGNEYERYVKLLGTSLTRGGKGAAAVLDEILNGARTHYYSHSGSARAKAPAANASAAKSLADEILGGQ